MKVKEMHMMRLQEEKTKRAIRHNKKISTPLAKEIEMRREEMIRGILGNTRPIIEQQLRIASLEVSEDGKNNDTVLKATTGLLDRVYGKPKESIDFTGNVQFSLKELAAKADMLKIETTEVEILE